MTVRIAGVTLLSALLLAAPASAALAEQASTSGESRPNWDVTDSGKTLRLVLPLYYSKACLDCHGEPKGVRDISGYPREGGKEGELGGAISVKLPIK